MTPRIARSTANNLSKKAREFLILHTSGPVSIVRSGLPQSDRTDAVRKSLLGHGLIAPQKRGTQSPTHTQITELGRWVACAVLADIADLLANNVGFIPAAPSIKPETPAGDALLRLLIENHRKETIS